MSPSEMNEVATRLFERWGHEASAIVESREELGRLLSISIGLGSLFNESEEAERHWMQTPHPLFKTRPITMVLAGKSDDVAEQVLRMRGF